jgi:energy-coupling factor transporter transmembrane protein EcfT
MKGFAKLCTPAKIYFAIAVIAAVFALLNGVAIMFAFWQLLFAFVWTFILGWLCKKGYTSISWFLVLLPYILMALGMLNIYHAEGPRRLMRAVKLQGAYGREAFGPGSSSGGSGGLGELSLEEQERLQKIQADVKADAQAHNEAKIPGFPVGNHP